MKNPLQAPQLENLQSLADKISPGFVDIRVHITGKHVNKADAKEYGGSLAKRIHCNRLDAFQLLLAQKYKRLAHYARTGDVQSTGVMYSGPPLLEKTIDNFISEGITSHRAPFHFHSDSQDIFTELTVQCGLARVGQEPPRGSQSKQ